MNFTHYRLGHVDRGSIVEVTLKGSAANVRLMDNSNFNSYKAGRQHRYIGGLAKQSPARLQVPRSGNWLDYSPSLADRLARSTSTYTVEEIAAEIVHVIRNPMAA